MKFIKNILLIFLFLILSVPVQANSVGHLTANQIERLKAVKSLLGSIDKKPLQETVVELEKSGNAQINLEVKEAMARAYMDIVKEVNVEGYKKREWLYSMVCLNMAYFQFGGGQGPGGNTSSLNKLIRQKLKKHLPEEVFKESGFLYSIS